MEPRISRHFTVAGLLRYTAPTAFMMAFTSIYGVVDGLFVSNFVGKEAFSALNLIYPLIMLLGSLGFMLGTGGVALVAKTMGQGEGQRARGLFSFFMYVTLVVGLVCTFIALGAVRPLGELLGAQGSLLEQAVVYGSILALSLPFLMVQQASQSYFAAAGKPKVGLAVIVGAGVANVALDALFIIVFGWGLAGAAIATAVSEVLGGGIPLIYFLVVRTGPLSLGKPAVEFKSLGKACVNGSSELVANASMSLVSMLYNYQLMSFIGPDGVAAYGVVQYVAWIFVSLFLGFNVGCAPLVSYQYGAKNTRELQSLFRKSLAIIGVTGVALTLAAQVFARPLALFFVGYDEGVTQLTVTALQIYSVMLLIAGFSLFGSAFFTALNNGLVSALISFLRTLVFEVAAVLILPTLMGASGIWYAIVVAEAMAFIVTCAFLGGLARRYGYARTS